MAEAFPKVRKENTWLFQMLVFQHQLLASVSADLHLPRHDPAKGRVGELFARLSDFGQLQEWMKDPLHLQARARKHRGSTAPPLSHPPPQQHPRQKTRMPKQFGSSYFRWWGRRGHPSGCAAGGAAHAGPQALPRPIRK